MTSPNEAPSLLFGLTLAFILSGSLLWAIYELWESFQ